eukprot:PITA_04309
MISLAAQMGWQIHQMDVKTTFFNGEIEEEVYIEQLDSNKTRGCRLKRTLYGLMQSPKAWYECIDKYLQGVGFVKRIIEECKRDLATKFQMKDLGLTHYFLGMEVWQTDGEIFLGQGKYCIEILRIFEMEDCRAMSTPLITNRRKIDTSKDVDPTLYRQLIGSIMYLVNTRPDISFVVKLSKLVHG